MSGGVWSESTPEELASITADHPKVRFDLVEHMGEGRASYELEVYSGDRLLTSVFFPAVPKDSDLNANVIKYRRAGHRRDRIRTLLGTSIDGYDRHGEFIISQLGTGKFRDHNGRHISLHAELNLIQKILSCAQRIGLGKITQIGRTTVSQNGVTQALEYLANETEEQIKDFSDTNRLEYLP